MTDYFQLTLLFLNETKFLHVLEALIFQEFFTFTLIFLFKFLQRNFAMGFIITCSGPS